MNFQQNSGKPIQQAFEEYDAANPKVYVHFCRLAFRAIKRGAKRISAKLIINVIRWEVFIQPRPKERAEIALGPDMFGDNGRTFKINDAYASRYARKFIREFPEHEPLFEMRELRA
jgi:hypothetical protein